MYRDIMKKMQVTKEEIKDTYSGCGWITLDNIKTRYRFKEVKEEVERVVEYYLRSK
ncbi:MAG: hypothetical protein RR525_05345 [Cellulosilyticaceae bacterium]